MSAQPQPGPIPAMTISEDGLKFIYRHEACRGVSNHLYWPGGASGVTLGAGYDMKERSSAAIVQDLTAVGIDPSVAQQAAACATFCGDQAADFARGNHTLIDLTPQQETQLLSCVVPQYEAIVLRLVSIPLLQYQFDALVSFAYNPGGRLKTVAAYINAGRPNDAMAEIKKAVTSGGQILSGLVKRRDDEVNLYLNEDYGAA